ncbi:MAG: PilZ domain-containing protein [Nitrospirales bacterium]
MQPTCPQCGQEYVRWTSREGAWEYLLSWLKIYPFRCQLCTHRFRSFQWRPGYSQELIDRRQYEHLAAKIPVILGRGEERWEGTITDIAMGGCAIKTKARLQPGVVVSLQLKIFASEPPVLVDTAVVRSVRMLSLGMQFVKMKQPDKDRLGRYVARMVGVSWGPAPKPGQGSNTTPLSQPSKANPGQSR